MARTQAAKDKLLEDFGAVIEDSQELLKAMAAAPSERAQALRGDLERKLGEARKRLADLQDSAIERGRAAARYTDEYVHENPWQSIAIGAGVAALVGIAIGAMLADRR
jgi:ElaB/YqjD/DUF883 family membrane-anchored ribosome-binding protein